MAQLLDEDAFEHILEGENGEGVATLLGVLAASRVVPLLAGLRPPDTISDEAAAYALVALRALATARAWVQFPARRHDLREPALNAALAAAKIRPFKTGDTATGRAAAQASIEACASVAFGDQPNARTGRTALSAFAKASSAVADGDTIEGAAARDASALLGGVPPAGLLSRPLWPDGEPDWMRPVWERLRAALLASDESWSVWVGWYEAVRDGRSADGEALAVARVLIPDEVWQEGPTSANDALLALGDPRA